jgi:protein transport protein SEC61 subunit gamma-like protein
MDLNPSRITEELVKAKNKVVDTYKESKRVLKITEKPDTEEFKMSAKITGAGMIIIGAIGFMFYLATNFIPFL